MISLQYREFWSKLSGWLADELDQLVLSAQTKWFAQHDGEGGHTDVTAGSVTTGTLQSGPGVFAGHVTPAAANLYNLGSPSMRWGRLHAGSFYNLTGGGIASEVKLGFTANIVVASVDELVVDQGLVTTPSRFQAPFITLMDGANPYSLYVSSGKLYIVSGTTASGGTVVGTQT